jgi:phage N-6-adenine-methyltransferase
MRRKSIQNWRTPKELFAKLDREVGGYDIDLFADDDNHLCDRYYTEADSAFDHPWVGRCFGNPPYTNGFSMAVCQKARQSVEDGTAEMVDLLLKCDTSTKAFAYAFEHAHAIELFTTRISFVLPPDQPQEKTSGNNFASMLVRFRKGQKRGVVLRSMQTGILTF